MRKYNSRKNNNPKYKNKNIYDDAWFDTYDQNYETIRKSSMHHKSFNALVKDKKAINEELKLRRREIKDSKYTNFHWFSTQLKSWCWIGLFFISIIYIKANETNIRNYISNLTQEESPLKVVEVKVISPSTTNYDNLLNNGQ